MLHDREEICLLWCINFPSKVLHFPSPLSVFFFTTTPLEVWKYFISGSGSCPLFSSVCDLRTSTLFSFLSQEEGGSWLGPCTHHCFSTYNMFAFLFQLHFYLAPFSHSFFGMYTVGSVLHLLSMCTTLLASERFIVLTESTAWLDSCACGHTFCQPQREWVATGHDNPIEM